jgi:hypothetical protein
MKVVKNKLVIEVDLGKDFGLSSTGKSIIISSSEGNQGIPGAHEGFKIGLNIYKPAVAA